MIKRFLLSFIMALFASGVSSSLLAKHPETQEKNLIIYEIATKGFTSPDGPESGTFNSLKEKVPYLSDLGINAVWLTGYSPSTNLFYNVWSQYASVRPDRLAPDLGTSEEFKAMVDEFHKHGIKVFLDVITHGVLKGSPIIKEHPDWFKGNGTEGSWGMIDYKWGNTAEFRKWYTNVWRDYITKYGIDGFRLDLAARQPNTWRVLKNEFKKQGVGITIFSERYVRPGNSDAITFKQGEYVAQGKPHQPPRNENEIVAFSKVLMKAMTQPAKMSVENKKNNLDIMRSTIISCHDLGWKGSPLDKNPYVVQGRRVVIGYMGLLLPSIPIMMSGEEFDCDFRPLPTLSPYLFGGKDAGKGVWLYGSWIDWKQLNEPRHKEMFNDTKKLIAIRKQFSDIIHSVKNKEVPNIKILKLLEFNNPDKKLAIPPYVQWNDKHAIVVIPNCSYSTDVSMKVDMDPALFQPAWKEDGFIVTDVWNDNTQPVTMTRKQLKNFAVTVKKDKTPHGGLAIFEIKPE